MKRRAIFLFVAACSAPPPPAATFSATVELPREYPAPPTWSSAVVRRATREEGRAVLGAQDDFIRAMSPFDRSIRAKLATPPTIDVLCPFLADQALDLSDAEWDTMRPAIDALGSALRQLSLPLPGTVLLLRTTGAEEFDVPYTRGNAIVLPPSVFRGNGPQIGLLAHELFHIASRNNAEFRDQMYELAGFEPIPSVVLPSSLEGRRITNPDGYSTRHAITVKRGNDAPVSAIPILSSKKPADQIKGSPLESLELVLLVVDAKTGAVLVDERGAPRTLDPATTDYNARCAINTDYAIHPDEVLADNFALLARRRAGEKISVPKPSVLDEMEKMLLIQR